MPPSAIGKLTLRRSHAPPTAPARPATRSAAAIVAAPTAIIGWATIALTIAVAVAAPAFAAAYALAPLLLGIVVIGLPHGALDHRIPERLGVAWAKRPAAMAAYLGGYALLALAVLGAWSIAPTVAFVAFLAATLWHWGQGDIAFLERFAGRRRTRFRTFDILLRGALPMAVSIWAHPETAEALLTQAAAAFGRSDVTLALGSPAVAGSLAAFLIAALVTYAIGVPRAWPTARGRAFDVAEVALLIALFAIAPAYLAIGMYFLWWHSLRHLAHLLLLQPGAESALPTGRWGAACARLAVDLLPITLIAVAFLIALTAWALPRVAGVEGFTALYLAWISALTAPHMLVVAWLEARSRVGVEAVAEGATATRVRRVRHERVP